MASSTNEQLVARAAQLVNLDSSGRNIGAPTQVAAIMAEFDVTRQRANTAVATAARRQRNAGLVDDPGPADFMLRVRLTERQRERLQILADQEAGGDMSRLVRSRLFA